jgi:hypothetical protein
MMSTFITCRDEPSTSRPIDALVREMAREHESFSAAVVRLIEAGVRNEGKRRPPSYVATGDGPEDLGEKAELYLKEIVEAR